ncbi:MAG: nucleotidyltransferase domain-containing protein [Bacilli bacterium]|nr:nucleotidyltransferase domain-containing protein [Bacilli bacterium]
MENIEIKQKYVDVIKNSFDITKLTLILYGSTVYGTKGSDLDICFIADEEVDTKFFEELIKTTISFHIENKLRIDEDIAFEDKLLYSKKFVKDTIDFLPFPKVDGKFIIPKIKKNKQFLSSIEMKKRLLLNILTVKREILFGQKKMVSKYSEKAWEEIFKVVISYCELESFRIEDIVNNLYKDPFYGNFGELYLGYKDNILEKKSFLESEVGLVAEQLTLQKKLTKNQNIYVAGKEWLNN